MVSEYLHLMNLDKIMTFAGITLPCKHAQGYAFVAEADGNLMPQSCLASHAIGTARGSPNDFHKVKAS